MYFFYKIKKENISKNIGTIKKRVTIIKFITLIEKSYKVGVCISKNKNGKQKTEGPYEDQCCLWEPVLKVQKV